MSFAVFNPIRKLFPLAASGELMLMRTKLLNQILPLKPCKAEDTLINQVITYAPKCLIKK